MPYHPTLEHLERRDCPSSGNWADYRAALATLQDREESVWHAVRFPDPALTAQPTITAALEALYTQLLRAETAWQPVTALADNLLHQVPVEGFPRDLRLKINGACREAGTVQTMIEQAEADVGDALHTADAGNPIGAVAGLEVVWAADAAQLRHDAGAARETLHKRVNEHASKLQVADAEAARDVALDLARWQSTFNIDLARLLPVLPG